jgi:hypothetical protein
MRKTVSTGGIRSQKSYNTSHYVHNFVPDLYMPLHFTQPPTYPFEEGNAEMLYCKILNTEYYRYWIILNNTDMTEKYWIILKILKNTE